MTSTPRHNVPTILQPLHTEEFRPVPLSKRDRVGIDVVDERGKDASARLAVEQRAWTSSRLGTAAALLALNRSNGDVYYDIDAEADIDIEAAEDAFAGTGSPVIDVQTHFLGDRDNTSPWPPLISEMAHSLAPRWGNFTSNVGYQMDEYFRCIFVESETDIAVLTSAPGIGGAWLLTNEEMAATRELTTTLGGQGRLLNHTVVRPTFVEDLERMELWSGAYGTVGWKVYTAGSVDLQTGGWGDSSWQLDSPDVGIPFLERVRETGPRLVCAHKGMSALAPGGSPSDVPRAARMFPDIDFVVYHSGWEVPNEADVPVEVAYSEQVKDLGVNRLITACIEQGIGPGANVYAEIGATWFMLIKRPVEAAHVIGKLLVTLGEDNVLWGTDSIWWGSNQPLIDAFRAFQIPPAMREKFGYPELTAAMKDKIFGLNATRVYGIDRERARELHADDDVTWARAMMRERRPPALRLRTNDGA